MDAFDKLLQGHKQFHDTVYAPQKAAFDALAEGQAPKTMIIACSDSRVDPATITQAEPGDLFVVRNVANLVPRYAGPDCNTHHGTSAALEYGVNALGVENIIVLGHWGCGGIEALIKNDESVSEKFPMVYQWMQVAKPARDIALDTHQDEDFATWCRCAERENIKQSLKNLMTFPYIKARVEAGTLTLHGWYFDIRTGALSAHQPGTDDFLPL